MKKLIVLFAICFFVHSCGTNDEKLIPGVWIIKSMSYEGKDVMPYLIVNVITIHADNSCDLPIGDVNYRHTDKEKGKWESFKKNNNLYFKVETSNELFLGEFKVDKISKEEDKNTGGELIEMMLTNDKIKLVAIRDASDKGV